MIDYYQSRVWWRDKGLVNNENIFRKKKWEGQVQEARAWDRSGRPADPADRGAPPSGSKYRELEG